MSFDELLKAAVEEEVKRQLPAIKKEVMAELTTLQASKPTRWLTTTEYGKLVGKSPYIIREWIKTNPSIFNPGILQTNGSVITDNGSEPTIYYTPKGQPRLSSQMKFQP